jgi:O-acetyl-ADP-ribose deacetylase (regulator of RNase III)
MPSRWVIHTVGPKAWEHDGGGPDLLAACHTSSLALAERLGARSVSFPAISCGVYGWSVQDAAPVALAAVHAHPAAGVELVRFVLWNEAGYQAFADAAAG